MTRGRTGNNECGQAGGGPGPRRERRAEGRLYVLVLVCLAAPVHADFAEPRLVTDGSGTATQTATGLDLANNAYISSVMGEKILVKIIGPSLDVDIPLEAAGLGQADPDFATSSRGVTYMSFSQLNESAAGEGRDIYLTDNEGAGGTFKPPVKVASNRADDHAPRLVLDENGRPHLAWAQQVGETSQVLYWNGNLPGKVPLVVGPGDYPHLFIDREKRVHLVYSKANDIHYNNNSGGHWNNEKALTTTPFDLEVAASIGGDQSGNILVCFESRNSLYFAAGDAEGSFQTPRLLDAGGILDPSMRVRSRGQVTIVYAKQGDIYYIVGQTSFLTSPQRITRTSDVESHPSLEIDRSGNIHLSYVLDGEVYYTNNAATPVAELAGIPASGEAPLKVRFGDLSNGDIQLWHWDFGDGGTSNSQNPTHTYTAPGTYTVSLRVSAPGATESVRVKEDFIFVQHPFNTLRIPDQKLLPDQDEVWFPVLASHQEAITGFQLMGTYDPNILSLKGYDFTYGVVAALGPDQVCFNDKGTYIEMCCIFDFFPPHDIGRQYLSPGTDQTLVNWIFGVSPGAPQGVRTRVDLVNDRSLSPVFNIFIVDNHSRSPALTGANVEVLLLEKPHPGRFVRGDVDSNGAVNITDAIHILSFLFAGGPPPVCMDAGDIQDTGNLDISAPISLLTYMFLGGPPPAVPFPNEGLDPSADDLTDC
ncbi:MAG TPA: PKD domain-containing protein [Planctomycetota bacterium]|nr:PKD domain-containing protein [Planctomycetota bacterium]